MQGHFKSVKFIQICSRFYVLFNNLVYLDDRNNIISVKKFLFVYFQEKYLGCR